jgi:hypothetical protein
MARLVVPREVEAVSAGPHLRAHHPGQGQHADHLAGRWRCMRPPRAVCHHYLDRPAAQGLQRAPHPQVAMLYSNPTGSGLAAPPAVLVQGEAVCPDRIVTQSDELDALGRLVMVRQPVSARYSANPLTRWLSG